MTSAPRYCFSKKTYSIAIALAGRMEKQETDTDRESGNGKRKRPLPVFCANTTELDACMCAVVCDKLVCTVLCAV